MNRRLRESLTGLAYLVPALVILVAFRVIPDNPLGPDEPVRLGMAAKAFVGS